MMNVDDDIERMLDDIQHQHGAPPAVRVAVYYYDLADRSNTEPNQHIIQVAAGAPLHEVKRIASHVCRKDFSRWAVRHCSVANHRLTTSAILPDGITINLFNNIATQDHGLFLEPSEGLIAAYQQTSRQLEDANLAHQAASLQYSQLQDIKDSYEATMYEHSLEQQTAEDEIAALEHQVATIQQQKEQQILYKEAEAEGLMEQNDQLDRKVQELTADFTAAGVRKNTVAEQRAVQQRLIEKRRRLEEAMAASFERLGELERLEGERQRQARQQEYDAVTKCIICMDRDKCIAVLPCGHVCLCEVCRDTLVAHYAAMTPDSDEEEKDVHRGRCPKCRRAISSFTQRLYVG
mmetsp:Transcript_46145/g.114799  ORF Transcript_46145/g.114799 Transcript_46145/m.114799 type:complete len:349 (-) Transcript_46145:186-1232(-)